MTEIDPTFFKNPYKREDFMVFLNSFLPEDFSAQEEDFVGLDKYKTIVDAKRIGQALGLDISVIEITHNTGDARIAIATDAFKLMADNWIHQALVIFKNDTSNYRFSYLTIDLDEDSKGKVVHTYSNPRRYSFFLGDDAKVNTPYQQLIRRGSIKDSDDLQDRFSLEIVNKEFYAQLVKFFNELISDTGVMQLPCATSEEIRKNFAVRLIGRIIFTWFLKQKRSSKGRLVPDELLSSGAVVSEEFVGGYYHDRLERLFFELLNTPMHERNITGEPFDLVPYLNGGLFSPHIDDYYDLDKTTGYSKYLNTLTIKDDWFKGFFEFLETYNFTIDENTAFDQELSIDPEMLGRIFENLLAEIDETTGESARKATGSFYTPRQIVDYMVDESLEAYFQEKTHLSQEKIKAVISYDRSDDKDYPLDDKDKQELIDSIEELKTFDPATGSGAFPIGLLQKLVYILHVIDEDGTLWRDKKLAKIPEMYRKKFEEELNSQSKDYLRKLEVIKNSIYGADIQPIAVEVARLRTFLTLIVEEEIDDTKTNRGIEPLPNLEFKFVCANTLIPAPEQEDTNSQLFADNFQENLKIQIDKYFSATGGEKITHLNEIRNLIDGKVEDKLRQLQSLVSYNGDKKVEHALAQKNKKTISAQSRVMVLWGSYKNLFENKPVGFFDIEYFFPSVKDGFDIVIGNPPYVSLEKVKENKDIYREVYKVFAPRGDLYTLFYERGLSLTKDNGWLVYITSNKWMRAGYGEKLRAFFAERNPLKLIDFGGFKVFESATVDTNILLIQNANNQHRLEACHFKNDYQRGESIGEYFDAHKVTLSDLSADTWFIGSAAELKLKKKLESVGIPLKEWDVDINRGILTGFNEAFIIDGTKKDELIAKDPKSAEIIKPLLRGKDIKRYASQFADKWLVVTHNGYKKENGEVVEPIDIDNYPAIKEWLDFHWEKISKRQDQGVTPYNLRDCAYLQKFEQEKIVWQEMVQEGNFLLDNSGYFCNDTGRIMTGENLKFLLAIFNSKIFFFSIKNFYGGGALGGSGIRMKHTFFERFPVPKITTQNQPLVTQIESLVDQILTTKKSNPDADTTALEHQIDELVMDLYNLTEEEKEIVRHGV